MPLFTRPKKEPRARLIGGEEFYPLKAAAERLGVSASTLREGLHARRFPFRWAKDGDLATSKIYVSAKDVEVYVRHKEKAFQMRLQMNAGV